MTSYAPNRRESSSPYTYPERGTAPRSREDSFVRQVKKIIYEQMGNAQFDVATLAQRTHLSVSQLNRRLKSSIKRPAGALIREMRMAFAAQLLLNGASTVGEIAFRVGYQDQANFCRCFKQQFGCTPSQYVKRGHS